MHLRATRSEIPQSFIKYLPNGGIIVSLYISVLRIVNVIDYFKVQYLQEGFTAFE